MTGVQTCALPISLYNEAVNNVYNNLPDDDEYDDDDDYYYD